MALRTLPAPALDEAFSGSRVIGRGAYQGMPLGRLRALWFVSGHAFPRLRALWFVSGHAFPRLRALWFVSGHAFRHAVKCALHHPREGANATERDLSKELLFARLGILSPVCGRAWGRTLRTRSYENLKTLIAGALLVWEATITRASHPWYV